MKMIDKKIAICLLARDSESALKRNIPKIEKIRKLFRESYVIVIENDSKDNTKQILKEWQKNSTDIYLQMEDTGTKTIPSATVNGYFPGMTASRMDKMIRYRNKYLEFVHKHNEGLDYVIVFDSDIYDFDEDAIYDTIKNAPDDWCGLFANGRYYWKPAFLGLLGKYYDAYCFIPKNAEHKDLTYKEIYLENDKLCKLLKKEKYVPCDSAFAGIGIYKYEAIKGKKYEIIKNTRSSVVEVLCDHVSLNLSTENKGTLYVAKNMNVMYESIKGLGAFITNILGNKFFIKLWEKIYRKKFFE